MNLDPDKLRDTVAIEFSMLGVLSIHGNLCLALRHPQNAGASRQIVVDIIQHLAAIIVARGIMTPLEMEHATRLEAQAMGRSGDLNG